jgi:hypothetical protein
MDNIIYLQAFYGTEANINLDDTRNLKFIQFIDLEDGK